MSSTDTFQEGVWPREVSQREYEAYLAGYPGDLALDVKGFVEPPVLCHHDFAIHPVPASLDELMDTIVARRSLRSDYGEPDKFFLVRPYPQPATPNSKSEP